ncbi:putative membrane protein C16E9.09c [Colletotrichum tanaceti]|uniref:Putative membrane protein C16E9.09c n=1 Tax=Colletotrichum tanaceti TaxID=1306861 RepID=A0A4U6X9P0_9PEZI|nr:putative membrane protein C16E9.09c [Colletotrichum tanaceti]KAJ0168184.1 putative membrane protein C16E9.09c [Colletotrichum tanaceti]TKW52350.1 putative membrane protein C16E9.09c [Colletotrichum tanaceti]
MWALSELADLALPTRSRSPVHSHLRIQYNSLADSRRPKEDEHKSIVSDTVASPVPPIWIRILASTMRPFIPLLSLSAVAQALYFYIDGTSPKCFFEDLPKDTLAVGHYTAEEWDDRINQWAKHDGLSIYISVDEIFDSDHRVVSQRGQASGRFTFTAADAGDHRICFTPSSTSGRAGWLSLHSHNGGIRLTLDLAIGESSSIESSDKSKLEDIATRVKDLNARLQDIRREQVFQREREAEFRDQSESTNARVIRWMVIQLVVLAVTCTWQLSHLRSFFIKQKLT